MTVDISERKKAELALAERNLQLALAGRAALVGSFAYDVDTEGCKSLRVTRPFTAFLMGPTRLRAANGSSVCTLRTACDGELRSERVYRERRDEYGGEYRIVRPGGEIRWIEARCFVSYDGDGRPQRVVGVDIDVTERKRAEDHQRMLIAELDHRVKNVLATVSAVAACTLDTSSTMDQFVAALDGRIRSMATTHELLSGVGGKAYRWRSCYDTSSRLTRRPTTWTQRPRCAPERGRGPDDRNGISRANYQRRQIRRAVHARWAAIGSVGLAKERQGT